MMTRIPSRAAIFCVAFVLLCAWLATVSGELLVETEPQLADSGARPRPRLLLAPAALAPGQVSVIGPHLRSFDSRYFGPISHGQRVGAAKRAFAARSGSWVRDLE